MDLPEKEVLYRVFDLLFDCQDVDARQGSCSCYINENIYDHFIQYISDHWNSKSV